MKFLLFLAAFFVSISVGFSQAYVKPLVIGAVNPQSTNNSVVIEAFNMPPLSWLSYNDGANGWEEQYVFDGDTVNNFGIYTPWIPGEPLHDDIMVFASNGYLHSALLQTSALPMHLNYNVIDFVAASSDSTSDGHLTLQFDSSNVLGNYQIDVLQSGWNGFDTTHLNATTVRFDSLEYGYFKVYWRNSSNIEDFTVISMYLGDLGAYYDMLPMDVDIAVQHDSNNCDGWILANPVNVPGNLHNIWSDDINIYNTEFRSNLCTGFYSVFTYETSIATAEWVSSSTDTIIVANDGTSYIDTNLYSNVQQDTSYFASVNCNFDYNAPIDSVTYVEDTVFNNGAMVILTFEMTMYQDTSAVTVSDSLVLLNDSLIMVDVVIYCGGFPRPLNWQAPASTEKTGFEARRIALLRGTGTQGFIQYGEFPEEEDDDDPDASQEFNAYPNPVHSELTIQFEDSSGGAIHIVDMHGKRVLQQTIEEVSEAIVNVSNLSQGIYFLSVVSESGVKKKRIMKI